MTADRVVHRIKIGCCGFPKGMRQYFATFKVVEVQQTFYKPPRVETALRWRREAPPDFEFDIKAWQLITHPPSSPTYRRAGLEIPKGKEAEHGFFRPTEEVMAAWERTREVAEALAARVVVFQCPPRFSPSPENVENMRAFFRAVPRKDFLFAWEPRGEWGEELVRALCQELHLIHCVDPFAGMTFHGQPRYFRLHGGPGYRHTYSVEELKWLRDRWGDEEAYFMFNNITMYDDALRFGEMLGAHEVERGERHRLYLGDKRVLNNGVYKGRCIGP